MATTITSVALPQHMYSHVETKINDNTIRTYATERPGMIKMLAVFTSPKGEDRKMITINNGLGEFTKTFGDGPCSIYGQAFLNAKAAAGTDAAILQCMRVTAEDATYAHCHIYVRYRVVTDDSTSTKKLEVMFVKKYTTTSSEGIARPTLKEISRLVPDAPESNPNLADGWTEQRFISVIAKGRGAYGNNLRFRISNNYRSDKISAYKNYYFTLFENTTAIDERRICIHPDAKAASNSLYLENVINDVYSGSSDIIINVNDTVLDNVYAAYLQANPETNITKEAFDFILGIDKTKATSATSGSTMENFEFAEDSSADCVELNSVLGVPLMWGSDGSFAPGASDTSEATVNAINTAFEKAFKGQYDRNILSKYRYPFDVALDANFPLEVKKAMVFLNETRHEDHITYFDLGTNIPSLNAPYTTPEDDELDKYPLFNQTTLNDNFSGWTYSIDAYYGKIKDPYNLKIIEVTSTYNLAKKLPLHWKKYSGKHIPYAGDYGVIDSYIKDSVYPVYDDSIDMVHLDRLKDAHMNYAQIDAKGRILRANQDTRYPEIGTSMTVSNLTEINNCHVILDIKKDAENIAAEFLYHFNESTDLNIFNIRLETLTGKYAAAQVKKISAKPARTDEEAELGILHLYIEVVHKALVKIVQIDIDVNRGVES